LARTCCYALFKTTQPLRKHWREVPEELADLLEHCLSELPRDRLADFDAVLEALDRFAGAGPAQTPKPAPFPPLLEVPPAPAEVRATPRPRDWWRSGPVGAVEVGAIVHRLSGHSDTVLSLAFSPSGMTLLSGSADHSVRLWDVSSGKELKQLY